MFSKDERSCFAYWFAHWCAFQMTALNLHSWKVKYLFHDIEKPWLKLFWGDYKKVQSFHRNHNKHHLTYFFKNKKGDWEAMVIDWECSRFTKSAAPMNARETMEYECKKYPEYEKDIKENIEPVLKKFGL